MAGISFGCSAPTDSGAIPLVKSGSDEPLAVGKGGLGAIPLAGIVERALKVVFSIGSKLLVI